MPHKLDPKFQTLAHLLQYRLFRIPDYQRSYSWSSREREDLFKDINGIAKEGRDAEHFMATIVCLRRDDRDLGTTRFTQLEIVDGQQRLTTLIILLKAICRALDKKKKNDSRLAEELEELLVKPEGDNLLLLQTNHDASDYFAKYMREGTAPKPAEARTLADKELLSAIQDCRKFVKEWRKEGSLLKLAALIKNQLSFILYEIPDKKTVYTVFEVLNSRGMEVAWLDRLKSILMGEAFNIKEARRGELIQDLDTIWRRIYAMIGLRRGLDIEALRFAATLYSKTRRNKLFSERDAVDSLRSRATSARQIRKIAHWLMRVTEACTKVVQNPRQNAVTRIAQARLLAVAIYIKKDFKDDDRKMLLDCWERISFLIYGLHKKDTRTQVGEYCKLSWDILYEDLSSDEIRERIHQLSKKFSIEDAINGLRGEDCYNKWEDRLRYFFFRYEEHLVTCSDSNADNFYWEPVWKHVWANSPLQSIEHIRPQSKAPEDIKHTLGNLMLLPPKLNSKLRDRSPREKLDSYRGTGFHHAGEVAEMLEQSPKSKWSKKACRQREEKLLRWAADEWGKGC